MRPYRTFYVVYSGTSAYGTSGLRPEVTWMSADAIIRSAEDELTRVGDSFESMAGIEWVESEDGLMKPMRELADDERLQLSIEKLGDDGRLFVAYDADSEGSAEAFVQAAERYGLADKALGIVEELSAP